MTQRAGIYARISQSKKRDPDEAGDRERDGDGTRLGVDRQVEDCLAYAKRRGWEVVDRFIDNDTSATTGKRRPEYERMMSDVEAGKIDAIIVWALDRLHRRPVELERFIDLADRHHLELGSVGGNVDLGTPSGKLHARIMGSVARHEMEHKGERQTRAALQAAEMGRATGGPRPFGYQDKGMKLDARESRELRKMYDAVLAGTPLREIARDLNSRGVTTIRGNQWGATQVRAVLLRARNAGLRSYHNEVIATAQWPAVVAEDTWRAVVAVVTDPQRKTSPGFATRWLLSSIALCGTCGETVNSAGRSRVRADGTKPIVYRCRTRKHVARDAVPVDHLIEQVVVRRLSRPDAADLLVDRDAPDVGALREEAVVLRIRLDTLAVDFADGALTASQLRTATGRLRVKLAAAEAAMAHVTRGPILADLVGVADVQARWDALPFDRKRAVIGTLMVVTILPETTRGARQFNPELIRVDWRQ